MNPSANWYFECANLYKTLCPHKEMSNAHVFKKYRKGEFIYIPSALSTHIYLIVDGKINIGHYLADGQEVISTILTKGEIFGELALAGEDTRSDFAMVEQDATIWTLTIEEMKKLMYDDRELYFKVLKLIGLRLMKVERKLESLVFKDARTRIVEFIKDIAASRGVKAGYDTIIYSKLTHKDIATITGTSRQTVTTTLNDLRDKKWISFDRRRILIYEMDLLK